MIYGTITKKPLLDDDNDDNDSNESNSGTTSHLPAHFVPGPDDVVCARGKGYWQHEGNKKYRSLISRSTSNYASTTNKLERTLLVSEVIDAIHRCKGRFVKKETRDGAWIVVDDVFAREKVGQSLRDALHDKYRSSTKAKQQRRACMLEKFNTDIDRVVRSNSDVSQRMEELNRHVEEHAAESDFAMITLFSRTNSGILESIKRDTSLLEQYRSASEVYQTGENTSTGA